jgi:hypothetical protein
MEIARHFSIEPSVDFDLIAPAHVPDFALNLFGIHKDFSVLSVQLESINFARPNRFHLYSFRRDHDCFCVEQDERETDEREEGKNDKNRFMLRRIKQL